MVLNMNLGITRLEIILLESLKLDGGVWKGDIYNLLKDKWWQAENWPIEEDSKVMGHYISH